MTISDQMERFARQRGKHVVAEDVPWCYYRLGAGTAVLWLTGGMLAQAYLAHRPEAIQRLVLSSAGPADYARLWLAAEKLLHATHMACRRRCSKNWYPSGWSG